LGTTSPEKSLFANSTVASVCSLWECLGKCLTVLAFALENENPLQKRTEQSGCQWLIPVILATQEAEVRRIKV
jgi:hypothetical protein